jgi:hypothetical protein
MSIQKINSPYAARVRGRAAAVALSGTSLSLLHTVNDHAVFFCYPSMNASVDH